MGSRKYSTPVDLWSVGCIFGEVRLSPSRATLSPPCPPSPPLHPPPRPPPPPPSLPRPNPRRTPCNSLHRWPRRVPSSRAPRTTTSSCASSRCASPALALATTLALSPTLSPQSELHPLSPTLSLSLSLSHTLSPRAYLAICGRCSARPARKRGPPWPSCPSTAATSRSTTRHATHAHTHTRTHSRAHTLTRAHTRTHIHTHVTHAHAPCTHPFACAPVHACTCVCTCECMCVCMCTPHGGEMSVHHRPQALHRLTMCLLTSSALCDQPHPHPSPSPNPNQVSFATVAPKLCTDGLDLLTQMLRYEPGHRISAKAAMSHPYFKELDQTRFKAA